MPLEWCVWGCPMGEAKLRGTFEERRAGAKKKPVKSPMVAPRLRRPGKGVLSALLMGLVSAMGGQKI